MNLEKLNFSMAVGHYNFMDPAAGNYPDELQYTTCNTSNKWG
jgi:hypothetical protein